MKKQEIIDMISENLDENIDDYSIYVIIKTEKMIKRISYNFNSMELLGLLESTQMDIYKQWEGFSEKPEIIKKVYQ